MRPALRRVLVALAILAGFALLVAAVVPFVVPLPPAPGTVPPTRLAPEGDYYVAGDLRMFYQSPGEGEPVIVLLHGFGGGTPSFSNPSPSTSCGRIACWPSIAPVSA